MRKPLLPFRTSLCLRQTNSKMELEVQETYWGETSQTKGKKSRMKSLQTKIQV